MFDLAVCCRIPSLSLRILRRNISPTHHSLRIHTHRATSNSCAATQTDNSVRARPSTTSGRRLLTPVPHRRRPRTSTSSWVNSYWLSTTTKRRGIGKAFVRSRYCHGYITLYLEDLGEYKDNTRFRRHARVVKVTGTLLAKLPRNLHMLHIVITVPLLNVHSRPRRAHFDQVPNVAW